MRRIGSLLVTCGVAATLLAAPSPVAAAVGEGTANLSTNESWSCDQPSTDGSYAGRSGFLPDSELVGGPRADFFGRSIGEIRDSLVWWTIPMSGGHRILIQERALPAFNRAAENLAAEQAKGNFYTIKPSQTFAFSPRTIGGRYQLSLHAHGIAVDINSLSNPYRSDGVLISDMPAWFVNAWKDAGFCWGGDWVFSKDPMHFSWKGPAATPGYGAMPAAYPVDTVGTDYSQTVLSTKTQFETPDPDRRYLLGDGDGDGVADVFQLLDRDNGTRLEYSQTDRDHDWCAVGRDHAPELTVGDRIPLLGDYSRVGRNDLLMVDTSGATLSIEVFLKREGFTESIMLETAIPVVAGDAHLLGDHNRDGYVDLYVIHRTAETSVDVYDGRDDYATLLGSFVTPLGDTAGSLFTLGDRDLDELPDLFVVTSSGGEAVVEVLPNGYETAGESFTVDISDEPADVLVNDYDGDGRGDLWFWDVSGTVTVQLGNTAIPGTVPGFWHNDPDWECDPDSPPYVFNGSFRDDDDNLHVTNIEIIQAAGVTKGCNPPYNDDYCPDGFVTRGEMAAFLVRALGLTDDDGRDWFTDDGESVFEADINKLATAGVTKGCNPPENTEFCPEDRVSRGQMAAFLVRGLRLTDGAGDDRFVDDDVSIFEDQIDQLAVSGITLGCNPPANDRFCPYANVRRDEMASFISRALPLVTG
jgi:hypothetical protein